ncbi:MAG: hypothetical protein ACPGJS_13425 [Flammeovirgaceae bacterium]
MSANQRYKVKVNKKKPTEQEVNQHKNFNRILSQYNRTSKRQPLHTQLYKINKLLPVIFVMIFIIMIVMYYDTFKKLKAPTPPPTEQHDSINSTEPAPILQELKDSTENTVKN